MDGSSISEILEHTYREILQTRMKDMPVVNDALEVRAIGFHQQDDFCLGVMLTPWFMNLMQVPCETNSSTWQDEEFGSKHTFGFPGGRFEFILGHEEAIGPYLMCPLFSPMFDFADQEAAEQTAATVLESVVTPNDNPEPDEDADMRRQWNGELVLEVSPEPDGDAQEAGIAEFSRRDFLRGRKAVNAETAT